MQRPILLNSPLTEVAVELRFHGDLSLLASWAKVQQDLRDSYPRLLVPAAAEGVSPLLQPLRLSGSDADVMLAINSMALVARKYVSFEHFSKAFWSVFGSFQKHCDIRGFNRFGLRYKNVLPPAQLADRSKGMLHPCLKLQLSGWDGLPKKASAQPELIYEGGINGAVLRLTVIKEGDRDTGDVKTGTVLDFDCFQTGRLMPEGVAPFLEKAHKIIDDSFFGLVTEEYLRYLKGEEV